MRFYYDTQLGPNRFKNAHGFLICTGVPLARTGIQEYHKDELRDSTTGQLVVDADDNDLIFVDRPEDEVFRPETMASFEGMPFTNDHPDEVVTPENWAKYAKGHVQNIRRGTGDQSDLMLGDIVVACPQTIQDILSGKTEISAGYDAAYEPGERGRATQRNIVGNHMALVDGGRCGDRCAIGDRKPLQRVRDSYIGNLFAMSNSTKLSRFLASFARDARRASNDAELDTVVRQHADELTGLTPEVLANQTPQVPVKQEETDGDIHIHIGREMGAIDPAAATADDPEGAAAAAAGTPAVAPEIAAINTRLDGIEEMLRQLLNGDDDGEDENGEEEEGLEEDEQRVKDEIVSAESEPELMGETDLPGTGGGELTEEKVTSRTPTGGKDRKRTGDTKGRVASNDSVDLETAWRSLMSRAEILVPGLTTPTFDMALPATRTVDRMCAHRRRTVAQALALQDRAGYVKPLLRGRDLSKIPCADLKTVFDAAVELARRDANETNGGSRALSTDGEGGSNTNFGTHSDMVEALRDRNKRNRELAGKGWGAAARQ